MSANHVSKLLLLIACMAIVTIRAAVVPTPSIEERATHLLQLNQALMTGQPISADQVLEAYKEYYTLYRLQAELNAGQQSDDKQFEAINKILTTNGLDNVVDLLFDRFHGSSPPFELSGLLRKKVEADLKSATSSSLQPSRMKRKML